MPSRSVNPKRPCQTLSDYLGEVNQIRKRWRNGQEISKGNRRPLWFRGQPSAMWDLRPRLYREEWASADESEVRLEFEGEGLQLTATNLNRTKWEWYFLMQHYGAPTRLLDWSGNPLVALYFATLDERDDRKNRDAAVWVFDPWRWNGLHVDGLSGPALPGWDETNPYLLDLEEACNGDEVVKRWPIAIQPPSIDRRLANQTARFLLFGKRKDLVRAANRTDAGNKGKKRSRLEQIVIAGRKLETLRLELDNVGINHRILFPDLQGLGEHLSWEWKNFRARKRL